MFVINNNNDDINNNIMIITIYIKKRNKEISEDFHTYSYAEDFTRV